MLIDTHCHIHEPDYTLDIAETLVRAKDAGVTQYLCVGTSEESSRQAIEFAEEHEGCVASIGVHPHDTKGGYSDIAKLASTSNKIVAIGEIGLDYFYTNSPKEVQLQALRDQLNVAVERNLPVIFHVRDAFEDFWPILDRYPQIRGVLHSYTDSQANLDEAINRGLYIGVNGISTFTKDPIQQAMFDAIPLDKMLLETDAPFLTPHPYRGTVNEPAYVSTIAEFHANRRGTSATEIAKATTHNARELFAI